jgi:hypothetical protein
VLKVVNDRVLIVVNSRFKEIQFPVCVCVCCSRLSYYTHTHTSLKKKRGDDRE